MGKLTFRDFYQEELYEGMIIFTTVLLSLFLIGYINGEINYLIFLIGLLLLFMWLHLKASKRYKNYLKSE